MTKLKMINFAANSFVYTKSFTLENLPAMDKILIGQGSMNTPQKANRSCRSTPSSC